MTTMPPKPRIWIFNEASCAEFFKEGSPLFGETLPDLIVEIARGPLFAHYFNMDCPTDFPGISSLLSPSNEPKDFAIEPIEADIPILFSPTIFSSPANLGSALRALSNHPDCPHRTDVFIEVSLLEELLPWLHGFEGIGIVYGLGAAPGPRLFETIKELCSEDIITHSNWLGLHTYFSDSVEPEADELAYIESSLATLPMSRMIQKA